MAFNLQKARDFYQNLTQNTIPQGIARIASNKTLNNIVSGNINRFTLPGANPKTISGSAWNIVKAVPESILNIPRNLAVGPTRVANEINTTRYTGRPINYTNIAAGVAPYAEGAFDLATLGLFNVGKGIVKGAIQQGARRGFTQTVKTGAVKGAGLGAFGGLTYGLDEQYNKEFNAGQLAKSVGIGAALGGVLGGGISAIGATKGLLLKPSSKVEGQLRDLAGRWTRGDVPIKPKGMTKVQWDFQLKFNSKYNRNPYLPVYASDLAEATNLEASKRIGMQARNIRQDKLSTSLDTQGGDIESIAKNLLDTARNKSDLTAKLAGIPEKQRNEVALYLAKNSNLVEKQFVEIPGTGGLYQNKNLVQGGLSDVSTQASKQGLTPVKEILTTKQQPQLNETVGTQGLSLKNSNILPENKPPTTPSGQQSSPKSITQDKYAFSVNKGKLNISPEAKSTLEQVTRDIKSELQEVKGKKLSNEEVLQAAGESQILRKVVSREDTVKVTAAITKLRQVVAAGAEEKGLTPDFIDNLKTLNSVAADTGRRLKAFDITADPISSTGIKEELVSRLLQAGAKSEDIINASQNVDWNNPKQVADFYRKFVKPNLGDIVNEYRYINLLSSPKTHIVNAFSNALQATVVSPVTKLYSGVVDSFASGLTGKERQHYTSEVPAYYKGLFNSVGDAFLKAQKAFKGETFAERPDIGRLPTNSAITKPFQAIPRALEASDVFFRTLISAGEKEALSTRYTKQGKEISEALINKQAMDKAQYFVFRKALDPSNKTGQGKILSYIDKFTTAVYGFRKVPGVGWFIPFVQTPMNILKQGLEYSPAGVVTLPGAKDKTEQLSKALVGSTVFAGAAWLSQIGDSTWSAPTSEKQKEDFYASGRQPYSIKIGDQWVSYSRLGPLAYPIAMAAAIKYYTQQDPKALTKSKDRKSVV